MAMEQREDDGWEGEGEQYMRVSRGEREIFVRRARYARWSLTMLMSWKPGKARTSYENLDGISILYIASDD